MEGRRYFIKRFLGLSAILGTFFCFLFFLNIQEAHAATRLYTGPNNGLWETDANWNTGIRPNSGDDVIIGTNTVKLSAGQTADFSTLTVTNSANFILEGNIGTGGSLVIGNSGIVTQSSTVQQTLTGGGLTIHGNGLLRHATNTASLAYSVNFSANNITINSGGQINVDGEGFSAVAGSNGNGPGGGTYDASFGGGGAYGGNGGASSNTSGGISYCDPTAVNTAGSAGGSTVINAGAAGGGLIILNANTLLTINGTISARGGGVPNGSSGGGGSGGGVKITATTIAGTPEFFSVQGTDATSGSSAGGGGGGCVYINYSATNVITSSTVIMRGGTKGQFGSGKTGGAGQLFIKNSVATYGDLYVMSTSSYSEVASTTLANSSLTLQSLSLYGANFVVSSTYALNFSPLNSTPLATSTGSSTLKVLGTLNLGANQINGGVNVWILNGGTFTNSSTIQIATSSGLRIDSGATISNTLTTVTSSGDFYITRGGNFSINTLTINGGTTTMNNYTTTTARLELTTLNINAGALTHEDNSTATATVNVVNLSANNITIAANGSVNVDNRGYDGGSSATGTGPGGGGWVFFSNAGGGGHGGGGGKPNAGTDNRGGASYCNVTDLNTIGSGGGSATNGQSEGDGGGLIILNATSTLTINGTVSARGRSAGGNSFYGGGSGGGIKLTADTIAGTPVIINAGGGEAGGSSAGGGGGGCVQITYTTSNSITSSSVAIGGGGNNDASAGVLRGGPGQLFIKKSSATYGDLYVVNTSTPAVTVASTTQTLSSFTLSSLSLSNANYVIPSTYSLVLSAPNATPLATSTNTSTIQVLGSLTLNSNRINGGVTIKVLNGGTFTNSSTIQIATSSGLRIDSGATISNTLTTVTSSGDFYITRGGNFTITTLIINGGTTTLSNYTTSSARLDLTTLTINAGVLSSEDNSSPTATVNIVNVSANNITIAANGSVNVDGKGYDGGPSGGTAVGPGGGGSVLFSGGGGGGHGGAGGAGSGGATGGSAYCNINNVSTVGSGGGSGSSNQGDGDGGGLIWLNATSTLTINGTLSAQGRTAFSNIFHGGGAGGGIKLTADTVAGTPVAITVVGGNDGSGGTTSGGGGGGCVQVTYTTTSTIGSANVTRTGGTGTNNGSTGLFSSSQAQSSVNNAPTAPTSTSNITTTSVRYNWTSGGGTESYYVLDRSTDGVNFTFVATSSPTSTTNYTFTNLATNTRYWFRVASGDGTNATSSYVTSSPVYTLAAIPNAPALVTSTATNTLRITIDATTINSNPQTASTTYVVRDRGTTTLYYLQANGTWGTSTTTLTYAQLGAGSATTTTGLTLNSLHTIAVAAINGDGVTTTYGSSASAYTLATTPTAFIATVDSDTQISLSWTGNATQYYAENITADTNSGWISGTSYAFTGLTCNTAYSFRVKGQNGDGTVTDFATNTPSVTTNACTNNGGGNNGGGGGGGGGGGIPPAPGTSTLVSIGSSSTSQLSSSAPELSSSASDLSSTDEDVSRPAPIVASNPSSVIVLSKLSTSNEFKSGSYVTYTYSFKNTGKATERFSITRTTKNAQGKVVMSGTGTRALAPKQSFAYAVKEKLPTNFQDGIYTVTITILNSKKKIVATNGFVFYITSPHKEEIVATPVTPPAAQPATLMLSKIPTAALKKGSYLAFAYGFKNISKQTQTFRILREVIDIDTNKVMLSSKGYRSLKPQQSFSYTPKDLLTKQYSPGMYIVKITVYDTSWKKVITQNQFEFEIN